MKWSWILVALLLLLPAADAMNRRRRRSGKAGRRNRALHRISAAAKKEAKAAAIVLRAAKKIGFKAALENAKRQGVVDGCFDSLNCTHPYHSLFRTLDGTCNNLDNPEWGAVNCPFQRWVPNAYDDGVGEPRKFGQQNQPLPSPREVSREACGSIEIEVEGKQAHTIMQWGQFLDHDITLTPVVEAGNVSCDDCGSNAQDPDCLPIPVGTGDPTFPDGHCLDFRRSAPSIEPEREQFNQITAYIDASNVYGESASTLYKVREGCEKSHLLKTSEGGLLPLDPGVEDCQIEGQCFAAGDVRVNVQSGLMSMHNLWVQHHNKIAKALKRLTNWRNNRIFHETRKLIGALHQAITYNEFLPAVLGPDITNQYNLRSSPNDTYDETCNACLHNAFSAAAYRFGHSAIRAMFSLSQQDNFTLNEHFFDPTKLYHGGNGFSNVMDFLRGMTCDKSNKIDEHVTFAMKENLFAPVGQLGLDIIALNIQRGRDHGLPSYCAYRGAFGLPVPADWTELEAFIPPAVVAKLRTVYLDPCDLDLFVGIIAETALPGAMVGPLAAAMIATQFQLLKKCDRFFFSFPYEQDSKWRYTPSQISQIEAATLGQILCDHSDGVEVKLDAFSVDSPKQLCSGGLQSINLTQFFDLRRGRRGNRKLRKPRLGKRFKKFLSFPLRCLGDRDSGSAYDVFDE